MINSVLNFNNNAYLNFCSSKSEQKSNLASNNTLVWPKEFSQINSQYILNSSLNKTQQEKTQNDSLIKRVEFNEQTTDVATKAAGSAVLLRGAQACIEKLSQFCARILMKGKEFAQPSDVEKVANSMKTQHGLKADIYYINNNNKQILKSRFPDLAKQLDIVANGANAFYADKGNFAVAPASKPSLILHELGHAINSEKSRIFGGLQKMRVAGMYAPMVLAFLNNISGKQNDGKESFIERHAGTIGFCSFLPTIIEEGAASLRGINAAKKVLPKVKLTALKKNYFFAWMTYLLAGIGVGIASKLAINERKILNNKSNF